MVDAEGMAGLELRPVDEGIDEMVGAGIVNEEEYDERIESVFRVQVVGGDVHLLQYDLDRNGIVAVVSQLIAHVGRVPVKDGSNLGWHVLRRSHIVLVDGLARRMGSGKALIFSQIENCNTFLAHLSSSEN